MKGFKQQSGQALAAGLLLLAAVAIAVFYVFNTGQLSTARMRLQNTADATAYSTATVQARDLNFKAYTNRAMVANQIAIAQFVGLSSFFRMQHRSVQELKWLTFWIPYVGAIINMIERIAERVSNVVDRVSNGLIRGLNGFLGALSLSQEIFDKASAAAVFDTYQKIVPLNDPDVDLGFVSGGVLLKDLKDNWLGFQKRYTPPARRGEHEVRRRADEFRDVVNDTRDPFTHERSYTWIPTVYLLPNFRVKVPKYGGSELLAPGGKNPYFTWTAMDTVSVWAEWYSCSLKGCGWKGFEIPAGYGAAQSGDRFSFFSNTDRRLWGNGAWRNPWSADIAATWDSNNRLGTFDGLRAFYDLKNRGRIHASKGMQVLLVKNADKIRTSARLGLNSPRIDIEQEGGMASDKMAALAKAEAYFARPPALWPRRDGRLEYGNLYNPFWQPRLTETSSSERTVATLMAQALSF